jgi:hypothetical protein
MLSPKTAYHTLRQATTLIEEERECWAYTSLSSLERASYWRRGFLSRAAVLYDFERYDPSDYLSDYERYVETRWINGRFGIALDNKLLFHRLMDGFEDRLPELYGIVEDSTFRPIAKPGGRRGPARPLDEWIEGSMEPGETRVLKWVLGGGGHNVLLLTRTDGEGSEFRLNGEAVPREGLRERLAGLDEYVVTGFTEQAGYADALYPGATNTLRLVTMWDPEEDEPFVARGIHRIGTRESAPMDNWTRGGLSAEVDLETGELGEAVAYPDNGHLDWHETHPDSGRRIEGTPVPGWGSVRDRLLRMAETVPYLPYVGWDIVVTGDDGGFEVIEANNYPGVKSLQVHRPLMTDERIRRFYAAHGIRRAETGGFLRRALQSNQ